MQQVAEFVSRASEIGAALVLQDENGRFVFVVNASKHLHQLELAYFGIGGHLEPGESWTTCAQREAYEELGAEVTILPVNSTWHITKELAVSPLILTDGPSPFALYEMDLSFANKQGHYLIVIYKARLEKLPSDFYSDEVDGLVSLTLQQVKLSLYRKPTLSQLILEGAEVSFRDGAINMNTCLYPIGTATALAAIVQICGDMFE